MANVARPVPATKPHRSPFLAARVRSYRRSTTICAAEMSTLLPVRVGLVGPGLIGKALMAQLAEQTEFLRSELRVALSVVAVANSRSMLLSADPLQLGAWQEQLAAAQGEPPDLKAMAQHVAGTSTSSSSSSGSPPGCAIMVDCTASDTVPDAYVTWLAAGCHIATPNKKLGAGPLGRYNAVRQQQRATGRHFMYEATVGAGLPILSTLKALLETGDSVSRIEGVLSGTLSYIFNALRPGAAFSEVVRDAAGRGYTEPDPREDLSGMDVARKVAILARECGLPLELSTLGVTSLVPAALEGAASPAEFLQQLHVADADMEARVASASAAGEVVRYVGVVDVAGGTAAVRLQQYPSSHPFAQLSGSDNLVVFTTRRYRATPLSVRGPGAGAEVTAAGVFSDMLAILRSAGVPT